MHTIYLNGFGALWRKRLEELKQHVSVCVSVSQLQVTRGGGTYVQDFLKCFCNQYQIRCNSSMPQLLRRWLAVLQKYFSGFLIYLLVP